MRICFVCNEYPPGPHGGIGTFTQVLARALVSAGHTVRVAGVYHRSYPAADSENDHGVEVVRLRWSPSRLAAMHGRYRLYKTIAGWSRGGLVDLVEVPDYQGWAAGWPRLPTPVVARLNGSASYFAAEIGRRVHPLTYRIERASLRRADSWSSTSHYTAAKTRALFELPEGPAAILNNPIEQVPELPDPAAAVRSTSQVVFTGTLTEKKGVLPLVRAWPLVVAQRPDAELHLFGKDQQLADGSSMQGRMIAELPIAVRSSVHFMGHVSRSQLLATLRTAAAAVFPSYAEAFAIAPLEAMGCGCPTIYSRRGSGPELITEGVDGLLVEPDRPAEIADAILTLLNDRAAAERMGEAGRNVIHQRYLVDVLLPQNVQFFERAIQVFDARRPSARRVARSADAGGPA